MRLLILATALYPLLATAQLDLGNLPQCVQTCAPQAIIAAGDCVTRQGNELLSCICRGENGTRFFDTLNACLKKECGSQADPIIIQTSQVCAALTGSGGVVIPSSTGGGMTGPETTSRAGGSSSVGPTGTTFTSVLSSASTGGPTSGPVASSGASSSSAASGADSPATTGTGGTTGGETTRVVSDPTGTSGGASTTSATGAAVAVGAGSGFMGAGLMVLVAALV